MAESKTTVSRRQFLQSSLAAGVVLSMPWLPGCGDGDDGGGGERTRTTLHFDLSAFDPEESYVLHAIGSRANKTRLNVHTPATRAAFRNANKLPQAISDARLTHYEEDVDLPARGVQQIWVTKGTAHDAPPVLSAIFCGTVDPGDPDTWLSGRDTAIALIFHHNEIVRLDPDQAATVCAHIDSSPLLDGLAAALEGEFGPPFTRVPVTDLDGAPVLNDDGEQLVQWDPSDTVIAEADAVVKDVLGRIFDDPGLENANWHSASGLTSMEVAETAELGAAAGMFAADYPADARHRSSAHGLYFTGLKLTDAATRTIQLEVKNFWLRHLTAHVDFFNHNGVGVEDPLDPPLYDGFFDFDLFNNKDVGGEVIYSRLLSVIGANSDILGIPVLPESQLPTVIKFRMPEGASVAKVSFITLGLGGETPDPPPFGLDPPSTIGEQLGLGKVLSFGLTSLFNIGIPSFLLASAVGSDPLTVRTITEIAKDPKLWAQIIPLVSYKIFDAIQRGDARPALITIGGKLVSLALKSLPRLAEILIASIGRQQLQQAVPIVGWGIKMASIGAATAQLGQTVGEVLSSPPIFENKISIMLTTKLTIRHDPNNTTGFPATATRWEMQANYSHKIAQRASGTLPTTRTDPITLEYMVASGGEARIDVWFLTDTNWIAGHGTALFTNLSPDGVINVDITITENLVPLTAMTRYHHRQKLTINNGEYTWQAARDTPPTQTVLDLGCDTTSLCDLNGISLSQTAAMVGYSWQARSRTLALCGGAPTTSPVHRIQNLSFAQRPDDGLKKALCGYTGKPLLAYELRTAAGQPGRHFYLDPTGAAGGYHLRSVSFGRSPFDQTTRLSWGRFSQQQHGIAVHPSGFVVGVNTQFHKLEILRLADQALPDLFASHSVLKAGQGTRFGLLDTPIAVGVDLRTGAIYVLEAGNMRIQAFDVHGNPLARFRGSSSPVLPLRFEPNATYVDMAVESTGWAYVLSFVGNGANPSDYRLDIYDPEGMTDTYLSRTTGVAAGKMAVDLWRNVMTLNYEAILGAEGYEPSVSQWIPSTPDGCSQQNNPFCQRF